MQNLKKFNFYLLTNLKLSNYSMTSKQTALNCKCKSENGQKNTISGEWLLMRMGNDSFIQMVVR